MFDFACYFYVMNYKLVRNYKYHFITLLTEIENQRELRAKIIFAS